MKLLRILTLIALAAASQAQAQPQADDVIVEMSQAFRQGNKARLAQLLPLARGHALEPWAAYWELKSRLDTASAQEVQDFFGRFPDTYQEDRLRNDWLLLLGQRRDWTSFAAEYPKYRMNDDREVRCYALLVTQLTQGAAAPAGLADEVRRNWFAQREDDGCTLAASRLIGDSQGTQRLTANDAWRKARLAIEANRPRAAAAAVEMAAPEALGQFRELNASAAKFLVGRVVVASKPRKEMIVLALIKLATSDVENAARLLEDKWGPQLTAEERNWVWGVMGKTVAQRLGNDALAYYAKVSRESDLTDEMLAWKVRA
ncbi:MAG: Lytic transglycosylase, catalytic, partial [Ramlibacter sp.]|nr:Lytic transglycosylase, catalytic [Ramlibacter sp.]